MTINDEKSRVGPTDGTEFLGFVFKKFKIRWSDKAFSEFKRRLRKLTGRSGGVSLDYRLKKLALYVRGWMNYFGISEYYDPVSEIDMWLRRRIRACIWKQWKKPGTRIRELRKMGTRLKFAIFAGISRKGPWRSARTKAIQIGISNSWLTKMGLICIKGLWVKIHYQTTVRLSSLRCKNMSGGVGEPSHSFYSRPCLLKISSMIARASFPILPLTAQAKANVSP